MIPPIVKVQSARATRDRCMTALEGNRECSRKIEAFEFKLVTGVGFSKKIQRLRSQKQQFVVKSRGPIVPKGRCDAGSDDDK